MTKPTKTIHSLKCKLTDSEKLHRSEELARALCERDEHEQTMTNKKAAWKKTSQELDAKVRHFQNVVDSGYEQRAVECRDEFNWPDRTVDTYRLDTGELVQSRAMFEHELQRELELNPPKRGKASGKPEANA